MTRVTCCVCGKDFKAITNSHLRKHDMTVVEYVSMYPDSPIVSDEVSKKLSDNAIKTHAMGITGFKKGHTVNKGKTPWNKGNTKDDDFRILEFSLRMKGRIFTDEHRSNLSKAMMGKDGLVGAKNPRYGKKMTEEEKNLRYDDVWFDKFTNGLRHSRKEGLKKTKPEIEMHDFLRLHDPCGWEYSGDHSRWIRLHEKRRKNPDFINENRKQVIEVFGRYWHPEPFEAVELVKMYSKVGWQCLVVYDYDLFPDRLYHFLDIEEVFDSVRYF